MSRTNVPFPINRYGSEVGLTEYRKPRFDFAFLNWVLEPFQFLIREGSFGQTNEQTLLSEGGLY